MKEEKKLNTSITLRIGENEIELLDELATDIAEKTKLPVSRSWVLRRCMEYGYLSLKESYCG